MTGVLILGSSGMLGSMLVRVLGMNPSLHVNHTSRDPDDRGGLPFDVIDDSIDEVLGRGNWDWVINAIGATKPRIDDRDPKSVALATELNAKFPHRLAAAARPGQRIIAISTDGVFSGTAGPYDEAAIPDAHDLYGRSKAKGELTDRGVVQLRCSIIGPETHGPSSLLEWALSQPRGAQISGYTNQRWNGITTWHFAKLCEGLIVGDVGELPSPLHVVPANTVSKAELLRLSLRAFGRTDVKVSPVPADEGVDRTLTTCHPETNMRLWSAAGYSQPPTIDKMIEELALAVSRGA